MRHRASHVTLILLLSVILAAGPTRVTGNATLSALAAPPQTQGAHSSTSPRAKSSSSGISTSTSSTTTTSSSRDLLEAQEVGPACGRVSGEPLSHVITNCLSWQQQQVGCGFLEAQGYITGGIQSLSAPHSLSGNLTAPDTCGSSTVSLVNKQGAQQQQQQLVFDAGSRVVLAVVARGVSSTAYFFGRGAHKGLISLQQQPQALELCLAPPGDGSVTVQQAASYSPRLAPGSVSWQLNKTVQLPPVFADGLVHMIQGDAVEAAWTLTATKSGQEARYQGTVSGRVSITNSRPVPVAVFGVLTAIKGGPSATVSCGPSMPFRVPPCTTTVCSFTATYPQPPPPGEHAATTSVQYQEQGRAQVAVAEVQSAFKVAQGPAALAPAATKVPAGQAVVTDTQLPGQVLSYTGSGQQSYVTVLTCPASGSVVNTATLLASSGQQVTAAANVRKACHKLDVRLQEVGEPVVARWHWSVRQVASISHARLRSASAVSSTGSSLLQQQRRPGNATLPPAPLPAAGGLSEDLLPTTEDVTYTVHITRSLPHGREAPFTLSGKVVVTNPAPQNAKLAGVSISLTDPAGQSPPLSVAASCPILAVASGQSLTCRWTATPAFNPIGGTLVAAAQYLATRNGGGASGDVVSFESAPFTVGDTPDQLPAGPEVDAVTTPSTFGRTFGASAAAAPDGSFKRTLLQWFGNGPSSSPPTFSPAGFLRRVWGQTGANTVVTSVTPSALLASRGLPAGQHSSPYQAAAAAPASFAAPAPVGSLALQQHMGGVGAAGHQAALTPGQDVQQSGSRVTGLGGTSWQQQQQQQQQPRMSSQKKPLALLAGAAGAGRKHAAAAAPLPPAPAPEAAAASRMRLPAPGAVAAAYAAADGSDSGWGSGAAAAGGRSAAAQLAAVPEAAEPAGLLDDCADLSHELAFEPGLLPGRVVSGKPPSGRTCSSSVYVYSVRYGPYVSCSTGSKAAAAVQLITGDTRRVGSSVAQVDISVQGCKPGVDAIIAAARPAADVAAAWDMHMSAQHTRLQLQPGQAVNNSYVVSYSRHLTASAPRLYVIVSLKNTGHSTPLIGDAVYHVNGTCGTRGYERSSPFACASNKLVPGGSANCSFVVPLSCAAKGQVHAQLQLSTGETVRTPVTEFAAPDLEQLVDASPSRAACIKASYGSGGPNSKAHKHGKLVSGQLPKGLLCSPKDFTFIRQFGPYSTCGRRSAHVKAGFETADGVVRHETLLTALDTVGCDGKDRVAVAAVGTAPAGAGGKVPLRKHPGGKAAAAVAVAAGGRVSPASKTRSSGSSKPSSGGTAATVAALAPSQQPQPPRGSCVYQPWFWKHCMLPDLPGEPSCSVVNASLPGGQGARTPFFPYRRDPRVRRTYRQLMVAPKRTGNRIVDLHFFAAKVFIATQMNHYAGVAMPAKVREAYVQLGRDYFSVYDDRSAAEVLPYKPEVQQRVAAAAQVLADYTGGRHPGLPTCAAAVKQQRAKQSAAARQKQS